MSAFKPTAMLSSGLLARKGAAVPARSELSYVPPPPRPDGGPPAAAEWMTLRATAVAAPRRAAATVKLSLRLDPERHDQLRLACFHQKRPAQQLLRDALDAYLETVVGPIAESGCACLGRVTRRQ